MHALRHFYASVLLDAGESIRALSEDLGHADPGFTLLVYTHLMPASEDRTHRAVDRALGGVRDGRDGTGGGVGDGPDEGTGRGQAEAQVDRSAGTVDLGFRAWRDQMS